jgi:hypothetical protein
MTITTKQLAITYLRSLEKFMATFGENKIKEISQAANPVGEAEILAMEVSMTAEELNGLDASQKRSKICDMLKRVKRNIIRLANVSILDAFEQSRLPEMIRNVKVQDSIFNYIPHETALHLKDIDFLEDSE